MDAELLGDLVSIAPCLLGASEIAIVDQHEVQLAVVVGGKERALVSKVVQEIAVTVDIRMQALQLADQRSLGLFVFGIELQDFGMEQIAEKQRGRAGALLRGGRLGIEPAAALGFLPRHQCPADLLGIDQDAGLDGLMLAG